MFDPLVERDYYFLFRIRWETVFFFGDSHIRRLGEYVQKSAHLAASNFSCSNVEWLGRGGLRAHNVPSSMLEKLERIRPDVVVLCIGGNDVTATSTYQEVCTLFAELVKKITALGVQRVLVTPILPRFRHDRAPGLSSQRFNKHVSKINRWICKQYGPHTVTLKGFHRDWLYRPDGVHLNDKGNLHFVNRIQEALNRFVV